MKIFGYSGDATHSIKPLSTYSEASRLATCGSHAAMEEAVFADDCARCLLHSPRSDSDSGSIETCLRLQTRRSLSDANRLTCTPWNMSPTPRSVRRSAK
jgi:hypothetical protein